uniref:Transporter n=1 Tax=Castor canadensis TaxID=51338 RepID=A0A8C0WB71_CASCN
RKKTQRTLKDKTDELDFVEVRPLSSLEDTTDRLAGDRWRTGPPTGRAGREGATDTAGPLGRGVRAMEKARPQWGNPLQFVFACISYAVGLGNVWRFPYLCQMYGGGSFLVPYLVMLIVEGMPLLYLELAVGQRMRQGSIGAWRAISPYLGGVGVASVVVSFFLSMYYNVINAWGFWYLFHSFQDPLPWSVCPLNGNHTGYDEECEKASSTQYFWYRKTLNISPSIQENGSVQWEPALCLTLAWLMVYLCILRGTESTGKVGREHEGPRAWAEMSGFSPAFRISVFSKSSF